MNGDASPSLNDSSGPAWLDIVINQVRFLGSPDSGSRTGHIPSAVGACVRRPTGYRPRSRGVRPSLMRYVSITFLHPKRQVSPVRVRPSAGSSHAATDFRLDPLSVACARIGLAGSFRGWIGGEVGFRAILDLVGLSERRTAIRSESGRTAIVAAVRTATADSTPTAARRLRRIDIAWGDDKIRRIRRSNCPVGDAPIPSVAGTGEHRLQRSAILMSVVA